MVIPCNCAVFIIARMVKHFCEVDHFRSMKAILLFIFAQCDRYTWANKLMITANNYPAWGFIPRLFLRTLSLQSGYTGFICTICMYGPQHICMGPNIYVWSARCWMMPPLRVLHTLSGTYCSAPSCLLYQVDTHIPIMYITRQLFFNVIINCRVVTSSLTRCPDGFQCSWF